ncbi:MAG: aspartate/glutamate racemase family protein [Christensenella sp.]|nr:aspartate/glutamate racemase family protein [Christensenella sp.]
MKLHIINPNTSRRMTEMIRSSAEQAAAFGTEIVCEGLRRGPEYADCAYDGVIVSHELVQMVQADMRMTDGYDAYVVASFADPALDALRELTDKPVVGIAESALHFASFLGYKFAVINTLPRLERTFEDEVRRAGASDRLAVVKLPPYRVSSFLESTEDAKAMLVKTAREAIEQDGAEVIILAGGMLAGYAGFLSAAIGAPVLDGVKCAVKMAEALAALGLTTSKIKTYAWPDAKKAYIK